MRTVVADPGDPVPRTRALVLPLLGALLLAPAWAADARAQYFGRNKVQYDDFDFRVLDTDNFRIHFYDAQSGRAVRDFARMSERWYERLARTFQFSFRDRKPLIVYADQPDFMQTNAISGVISQGTGGVTESLKDRVILPFAATYGETDHVLGHELVHAFQFDIAEAQTGGGATGFRQVPGWLIEGMPEYMALGRDDPHTAMWMRDAVLHDRFPRIRDLNRGREFFPYRFGHALWAFIAGAYGDDAVPSLYRAAGRGGLDVGIRQALNVPRDSLSAAWRRATTEYYEPLLEGRTRPDDVGEEILSPGKGAGEMNVSPALSPDGSRVIFFSRKDLFTIDLFVADARTGEVEGKLASSAANPHFDAMAFIASAGAWSPDGRRFAFITFAEGDNEIAIADVDDREVRRTLPLEGMGAVHALDWSPDGSALLVSGSRGGVTDLYEVDVASGSLTQLTDDRFAELHPAYSPDGGTIAFATDRGPETDLANLRFSRTGLGFLDRETGEIEVMRPFGDAKHIDPRWSPDGGSLYFISDRQGFSDVYRLDLPTGEAFQVTRVATGVTGITDLSPALSVAKESGRLLFTVFREGDYVGYARAPEDARGEPPVGGDGIGPAGRLPPPDVRGRPVVAEYLADPMTGLPPSNTEFPVSDYDAGLQLDYLAQPRAGVAVDRFGSSLGGSVAAFFSDMLGNRQLAVSVLAQGDVQDIGGQAVYVNRKNRFNWGGRAGRIPFRTGFTRRGTTTVDGRAASFVDLVIQRTFLNRASLMGEYPLSTTRRFEGDVGVTRLTFDREVRRTLFDPTTGAPFARRELDPGEVSYLDPAPGGLTMGSASAAFVGDYSFFGFTSPVRGGRYRFELEGNVGDLGFVNALADYRRYVFARPFTFAFRGLHYGRYGGDAEDPRLSPLFLGEQTLVRGYPIGSFTGSECTSIAGDPSSCPEIDRLVGSRIGVVNAELRMPLLGTEEFGLVPISFLPTELSLFADGGVAWTADRSPELAFETGTTERVPVFSAGASLRFNVLGRLIAEVYWAHAFQRPEASQIGFHFAPGW